MNDKTILLVEDNHSDEVLTLRALKKEHVMNPVIVVRDGAEALDFLFAQNAHADRDREVFPQVVLSRNEDNFPHRIASRRRRLRLFCAP